jgi:hypothetical protein
MRRRTEMLFQVVKQTWDFVSQGDNYTDISADVDENIIVIGIDNRCDEFNTTDARHYAQSIIAAADWLDAEIDKRNGVGVLDEG